MLGCIYNKTIRLKKAVLSFKLSGQESQREMLKINWGIFKKFKGLFEQKSIQISQYLI